MDSVGIWGNPALWGILALVTAGTYVWRAGGTIVASYIKPDGALFQWFGCLAYGMLAGLISRIVLMPVGLLAQTSLNDRLFAVAAGFVLFFVFKRNMVPAMVTAVIVFLILAGARAGAIF